MQFPGPAILLGLCGIATIREWIHKSIWRFVVVLYLTSVAFAFSYRVNDQYVFYLPSYIAFVFIIGIGWDAACRRFPVLNRRLVVGTTLGLIVVLPPLIYFSLIGVFNRLDINPLQVRNLPGREPNSYFLWPAKNNYFGAYDYGYSLLTNLPPNSVLLADHTPFQTLRYLQVVHGLRSDIEVIRIEPTDDLMTIFESFPPATPVFMADNDPRYYNLDSLAGVRLVQEGYAYRLVMSSQ